MTASSQERPDATATSSSPSAFPTWTDFWLICLDPLPWLDDSGERPVTTEQLDVDSFRTTSIGLSSIGVTNLDGLAQRQAQSLQ